MYQGQLDGLCGAYAIVNAFMRCGLDAEQGRDLFGVACRSLSPEKWPDVLLSGAGEAEVEKMIKACVKYNVDESDVYVTYPIKKSPPKDNASFWTKFDEMFSDKRTFCAILHTWKPTDHWIVAHPYRGKIRFIDSDWPQTTVKDRDSLFAGKYNARPKGSQWLINREIMIAFSKQ